MQKNHQHNNLPQIRQLSQRNIVTNNHNESCFKDSSFKKIKMVHGKSDSKDYDDVKLENKHRNLLRKGNAVFRDDCKVNC